MNREKTEERNATVEKSGQGRGIEKRE